MAESEGKPRLMSSAEVAWRLNYSVGHVRDLLRRGVIPSTQPGGRDYRVEPADLEAYIHRLAPRT